MSTGRRQNPTNVNDLPRPPAVNYDAIFQNIQGNTHQIPGIASNIRNIGGDTDLLIRQTGGLERGLGNIGRELTDSRGRQQGIAGQLTNQDQFLRNTINPNIRGLYTDRALGSAQQDIRGDITGQTTALQNYISNQIGDVTANQALHDLNDGKIKGRAVLVP